MNNYLDLYIKWPRIIVRIWQVVFWVNFLLKDTRWGWAVLMSKDKIILDAGLISILSRSSFDNFTVLKLRDAYLKESDSNIISKVEARRFVYENLLRLLKKGLLKRIDTEDKRKTKYLKTEKFHKTNFASDKKSNYVDKTDEQSKQIKVCLKISLKSLNGTNQKCCFVSVSQKSIKVYILNSPKWKKHFRNDTTKYGMKAQSYRGALKH